MGDNNNGFQRCDRAQVARSSKRNHSEREDIALGSEYCKQFFVVSLIVELGTY